MSSIIPIHPVKLNSKEGRNRAKRLLKRSESQYEKVLPKILPIVEGIRREGDRALIKYIKKFDDVDLCPEDLIISRDRIEELYGKLKSLPRYKGLIKALTSAYKNIEAFHRLQPQEPLLSRTVSGKGRVFRRTIPIDRVAVYVPGGTAVYPSTLLMGVTPARIAGVKDVVVACRASNKKIPPPSIIIAAFIAGADRILLAGGAHAVSALVFGTESVTKVDKIVGPGGVYVNTAKIYLSSLGVVAIDFPAGPSEVMIIADDTARVEFIVWDMLSQAEHDENACAVLLTPSRRLAERVGEKLSSTLKRRLKRGDIIKKSLRDYGAIFIVRDLDEAIDFSNDFAPEHLQLMIKTPEKVLDDIRNAGAIFLGDFSPVAVGDYISGTNHILPTGGAARFASGVSVDTFLKRPTHQKITKGSLKSMLKTLLTISKEEGFESAHGKSVKIRLKEFGVKP